MTVVLDSSALAAVILAEPDAEEFLSRMERSRGNLEICAATRVEIEIVVEGKQGPEAGSDLDRLLTVLGAIVVPLDAGRARVAVEAWRRFGKGRHPAALSLGDCFSYSLASVTGSPLLYKGRDFDQTDVARAK